MTQIFRTDAMRLSRRQFLGRSIGATAGLVLSAGVRAQESERSELVVIGWDDYIDPGNIAAWEAASNSRMRLNGLGTNQEIYGQLKLASAEEGFDVSMSTDFFVKQLIDEKLIQKLDKSLVPNLANIAADFMSPDFDPENVFTVPKSLGYEGYIYDKSAIARPMTSWADFLDAMQNEASGRTTLLDGDEMGLAPLFWSKDISWNTLEEAALKDAEQRVEGLARHVKAFKDWAGHEIGNGSVILAQCWSGYARYVLDTSNNPNLTFVYPTPRSGVWLDCYHIPSSARNLKAAHSWLNFILEPQAAARETMFTHFYSPVRGMETYLDAATAKDPIIFPPADAMKRAERRIRNESYDRRLAIFAKFKAGAEM